MPGRGNDSFRGASMTGTGRYCEFVTSGSSHRGGAAPDATGWHLNLTLPPLWPGRWPRRATA